MRAAITRLGSTPALGTPEAFGAFMAAERMRWGEVIRDANISLKE